MSAAKTLDPTFAATAARILREQIAVRTKENTRIRKNFGDRITIALTQECAFRDREIEALEGAVSFIAPTA